MKKLSRNPARAAKPDVPLDDAVLSGLTAEDRDRLAMDAWEPSLLRRLLEAHGRMPRGRKRNSNGSS